MQWQSAVTDDGTEIRFDREAKPGVSNLLTIYSALTRRPVGDVVAEYEGRMYGHLKVGLAEVVTETLTPIQQRAQELLDDPAELDRILARGAEKGREVTERTLASVYDRMGFLPRLGRVQGLG